MSEWFENLRTLFREYPRMWVVLVAAFVVGIFAVWTIYGGFSFGLNRFFASSSCPAEGQMVCQGNDVKEIIADSSGYGCDYSLVEACGSGTCQQDGTGARCVAAAPTPTPSSLSCGALAQQNGASGTTSDTCCSDTPANATYCRSLGRTRNLGVTSDCAAGCWITPGAGPTPTPTPTPGGGDSECGPTIPNGGRLDWSFKTSEPWDDCTEGVSNATAAEYWTEVNVAACHPDEGFHLVWRAQHRPKATCNMKNEPVDVEYEEGKGIVTDNGNFDDANNLAPDTAGKARMTYTTATTNCGSVYMFGAFWAEDAQNPETYKHNNAGNAGYNKVINYGKDCSAATPVPTASTGPHAPSSLSVVCGTTQNVLTWTLPAGNDSNTVLRNVDGADGIALLGPTNNTATTFTDTDVSAGHTYAYRHKAFADKVSNVVTCPSPTVSPSTTVSPSPTASVAPLEDVACAPVIQTVQVNQTARLEASGGSGSYKWTIIQGGKLEEGGNQYIGVSYGVAGSKTLRVDSAGMHATCTIDVVTGPVESPTDPLTVQKTGRNTTSSDPTDSDSVTIYPGQTAQFRVNVVNNSSTGINAVKVTDTVPPGMSYTRGSTRIENQSIAADSVTTSGLAVGRLDPEESVTVQWSAIADKTTTISGGPNRSSPVVRVTGSGISEMTDDMSVTVYGSGASGAGSVPTGPGDAVLAALLTSAVLTLLYSGYTRSGLYRRREAEAMSHDQGPMDFRS